jgi:hypothetical protein
MRNPHQAIGVAALLAAATFSSLDSCPPARADDQRQDAPVAPGRELVIHEWGTFTCLQDETGRAIAGVNTDDEPVPEFVHRISDLVERASDLAPVYFKGVPRSHRQVVMRLETPVVYFYPPRRDSSPAGSRSARRVSRRMVD